MKKYIFILLFLTLGTIFILFSKDNLSNYTSSNISTNKDSLTFYVASDIHYLSKALNDNGEAFQKFFSINDGKQLNYIPEIFDSFIFEIKQNRPDILIISGDLTLNGEEQSHLELASKLKDVQKQGTSVYVIPGNHDINNPWARNFVNDKQIKTSTVSPKNFANIYKDFGYDNAISRDSNSLSYLVAPSSDLYILMIDDNNYNDNFTYNAPLMNGFISKETLSWIKGCSDLAKNNNAKIIAVSHHNFINHSEYIYDGYTLDNSSEVLNTFKACNIQLTFSGHTHLQSIKKYSVDNYSLHDISNSSLAVYPQKYGILNLNSSGVLNYNTSSLNVDSWSKSINTKKDFPPNFHEYSRLFYTDFVYNQNFNNLLRDDSYSIDDVKDISTTIRNIRMKYDDNLDNLTWDDIRNSKGFELLKTCNSPYLKHYVQLALAGDEINNNRIELKL